MRKVFNSVLLLYAAIFHSNQAPVFTSTPITQINENENYSYTVEVVDADGSLPSVRATQLPDWITVEPEFEVSTLAGGLSPYFNNGDVSEAGYYEPRGMAFDGNGNLFIADSKNHVIRKITPEGAVSSFAGAGYAGYADGTGVEALFDMPEDIAFDLDGNLLVADRRNHAIRRISPNGEVTTLAGNGTKGSTDGSLSEARFSSPQDLAVDSQGHVYINDIGNLKIRVLTTSNQVNTFIDRNFDLSIDGSVENTLLNGVHSIALDQNDHLHVGFAFSRIFKVDGTGSFVLLAGGDNGGYLDGNGSSALLNRPSGLTFSSNGDLYFSDANNHRIRKITPNGEVTTVAGTGYGNTYGSALSSKLLGARDLAFDESGNLFFTDGESYIKKLNASGDIELVSGRSQSYTFSQDGNGRDAILKFPAALAVNAEGEIYFSERGAIRVITLDGTVTTKSTDITGQVPDMVFGSDNELYFIESHSVKKMTQEGVISSIAGSAQNGFSDGEGSEAKFSFPTSIDLDSEGNLVVADNGNHRIRKVTINGQVSTIAGSAEGYSNGSVNEALFVQPMGVVIDDSDNIFVYDYGNQRIRKISSDGFVTTLAGNGYNGYNDGIGESASFSLSSKMVIDESNNLWMFDGVVFRRVDQNGSVKSFNKLSPFGSKDGKLSDASFSLARGLAYSNRRFFMTDEQASSIRQVVPTGLTLTGDPNGRPGIHEVKLLAEDGFGGVANQDFSIQIMEVRPPVFTSATTVSIEEGKEGVFYTATATAESQVTYSLGLVDDNSSFEINPQTGELQMTIIPDFENPSDSDGNNIYLVEIVATDQFDNSSGISITIQVTNTTRNELPTFISEPITEVKENELYKYEIEVVDDDGDQLIVELFESANWLSLKVISNVVSTLTGGERSGIENGSLEEARFQDLRDIVSDSKGNLYVLDGGVIRKVSVNGQVSLFSGVGYGDVDGPANQAKFRNPRGLAIDRFDNLYVADRDNYKIRKVDGNGTVNTISYSGLSTGIRAKALAIDADLNLYVADTDNFRIVKISDDGTTTVIAGNKTSGEVEDGNGLNASFGELNDIEFDSQGNLLILDGVRVRKMTPNGDVITLAGSEVGYLDGNGTEAKFQTLEALAIDKNNNVYVGEYYNNRIRKITPEGLVTTIAGDGREAYVDGTGLESSLAAPDGMHIDKNGVLYFVGPVNHGVRRLEFNKYWLVGDPSEQIGQHNVILRATDEIGGTSDQSFTISIKDVTPPVFITTPENSLSQEVNFTEGGTGTVYQAIIEDDNPNGVVSFTIDSGYDGEFFSIDQNGHLTFKESPDFDSPQDQYADNTYEVIIIAEDGFGNTSNLLLYVKVTELVTNIAPVFVTTPITQINDDEVYKYLVNGFDADGDVPTITAETIPDWLEFSTTPFGQVTTFAGTISSLIKNGPGAAASYNNPYGTAFDKEGNLYVADTGNNRIVKVTPDGVASTYVGTGVAGNAGGYREQALLNQPTDVAFDAEGNMYICDDGSSTVRKVNLEGDVSTLIGFARAISSDTYTLGNYERLNDVVVSSQGVIYLASNNGIRQISLSGEIESFMLNGNGFSSVSDGLAIDTNDNVYFSDPAASQIKVIAPDGSVSVFAGLGQPGYLDGEASQAKFENPSGLAYHPDGSILVSDAYYKIRKIDPQGNVTTIVNDIRDFSSSVILHLDVSSEGQIIALDFLQAEVFKVTESGSMEFFSGGYDRSPKNGPKEESTFNLPVDAVQDAEGNIYVSESHRIRKIDKDGIVTTFAGGTFGFVDGVASEAKFSSPSGLAIDDSGNLYVADRGNNAIRKIEPNGTVSTIAGNGNWGFKDGEALSAEFRSPFDLVLDDEGNIYVTDQGNNRIRKISPERIVSTLAGDGTYNLNPDDLNDPNVPAPSSITLDNQGNIYFTVARSLIRKIESDGSLLTIAGNTLSGGISDGVGTAAKFQNPLGLITDDSGNIYVADNEFNAVRKINPEGLVTTLAGAQSPGLEDKTGSEARFRGPSGLMLNNDGNLIVVDNGNHRLRELSLGNSVLSGSAVGQKGTHSVVLKITDESGASTTQSFEIEVIDVTAPVFTSPTEVEVEENTIESFFMVEATDANQLEYSLGTEKDESLFAIDVQTGELSFVSLPNFEAPQDIDQDNVYEIVVFASDGTNTSEQSISITVEDLDEVGPIVTLSSNSQGLVFTPSVTVNVSLSEEVIGLSAQSFAASNATITDFQGSGLAYLFVLNSLADGPASVKLLESKVFDAAENGNEASNLLAFNFEARNVAPTGITLSAAVVGENVSERVEVATLGAEDGDEADQHTFRLVSGEGDTDNAKFNIIGNKLFKRNEVSLDFETQSTLSVRIQVSDIRGGSFTTVKTINVNNIPEPSMSLKIIDATERELEVAGVNFGRVKVGSSHVRQLEVLNTSSDAELQVTEIKLSSQFTVSESIFILGIGEKKVLNVTYLPQEPGVHLGKLELVTNAGNQSLSVAGSAFANKKPIAIAPEARITHIPGNILKLIGFDPDGDEIEFVITANPALGSLEAQSGLGEYKFIPSGLAPETVYEDELKFKVVEKNGGLSSDEATLKFGFRIRDVKHTLLPIEIVSVDSDNMNIVVSFTDEVINNEYFLTGFYRGKEEGRTVFFSRDLTIKKAELTNTGGVLSKVISLNRNDYPALFSNSKLLLAVKLKTANGFESSNTGIFNRSNEGQLNGNAASDNSTEDGDFSVFALDSTVPENESVNINISAVEFGDFDFSGASLQITKSPANGTLGQPVLLSNQNGLAQWTVSYTSTTEIGIEDSFEFSVVHPVRNETLTGTAKVEVIGVPDAPQLSAIADQQVNEDETLTFSIEASDVDSDLSYTVISSESDISGTVSNGKLNITTSNNFNGSAAIQLVVSEANETSPQSVSQSFNLTVLPVNDAPVVTAMADQQVNEDGEISVALAATDLDGDAGAFSYSVTSDSDANLTYAVENGSLKVRPAADYNGVVNFTVKANDGSGTATAISAGENFKLKIVPVNDVPEVSKAFSTQTLIEGFVSYNLDLSKYFSDKETASTELVYSISNLTNVATSVNGKLLAISSVNGNTGLQTATVTASDGELSVTQQITFVTSAPSADVTIVNAITDLDLAEDFGQQTVDLSNVFAYSLNANASFTFSLAGNQNVDALINGNNLEISSTENFNGSDVVYITATVDGKSNLTSFNINISPVNDAPTLVSALADEAILEDAAFSKVISSSAFNDVDGDVLTYSATYDAAWLTFDATTRTFSGTPLNGDVGTVNVTLTAEDPSGAKVTDVFQIVISNTNDNPTNIGISASAVDENISIGTAIVTFSGTDPDVGDTNFIYSLVSGTGDTDNASFQIIDGQLKTLSAVNYEAKNSYSVRVKITDSFEGTFEKVFIITVNNVNEVATDITLATSSIAENLAAGAVIDGFATVDPDQGDTYSYSLVVGTGDTDNASFEIVSGQLVSKAQFNFEEKSSYSVRVQSTDAGGLTFEKAFAITVTDANDAPTAVTSTTLELAENSAIGTVIGQFSSTDEDSADDHAYSLIAGEGGTDNASFEFEGWNLKAKASFNFETKSSYSIRVQSSDGNGGTLESQFTVNITNVLEVDLRTENTVTVPTIGMGETETVELVLNNDGEDLLEITGISFPTAYSGSFTTASIAGGASETLTITFEPTEAGSYAGDITITSNAGTHVVNITGEAEVVAGIEDLTITTTQVKLYPNPASQFVEIDLTDLNGIPVNLSIKSINGTAMWSLEEVRQAKVTVDISSYADGAYLILIQTERGTLSRRFIIRK